jgi:hypothetical protein
MPDAICDQDADLIAKALDAGKVTRVPQGKSSYELPTWDAHNNRLTEGISLHWANAGGRTARGRRVPPEVAARRVRVREAMMKGGKTQRAIAQAEGVDERTIYKDIQHMRAKGFHI